MPRKKKEEPEFIEVEAEVIEPEHVEIVPARIDAAAYLAAKKRWLHKMMEPYQGITKEALAKMDGKELKACRVDVNRIIKEVEDERKAIKKAYNEPLERFEDAVKEMLEDAKQVSETLGELVNEQASVEKEFIRQGLEATYNDFAPALVPVVPFQRLLDMNPKWLNKSYGPGKAAQELEDIVDKIAKDWEVLKRQASLMRFYDDAEAEFFRTLDLSAAIARNDMREEEAQRIQAMKDEVEANRAALEQQAWADAIEQNHERYQQALESVNDAQPQGYVDLATGEFIEELPRKRYQFSALLNAQEVAALREWKNACGIGLDWKFKEVSNG